MLLISNTIVFQATKWLKYDSFSCNRLKIKNIRSLHRQVVADNQRVTQTTINYKRH